MLRKAYYYNKNYCHLSLSLQSLTFTYKQENICNAYLNFIGERIREKKYFFSPDIKFLIDDGETYKNV